MADMLAELRDQVSVANRILANEGIIDAFGHISVRHPKDPNRYLISRHRAAELVEPDDVLEFTLDSQPARPTNLRLYSELVIHGEIYKSRPDVNSVCHHHSMSVLPYCATGVPIVPLYHLGAALGPKVPFWDSRDEFGDTNLLVRTPDEGASLARALGPYWIVLMRRHGATVAGKSLRETVYRTIYTSLNAELQSRAQAIGTIGPLSQGETDLCGAYGVGERSLDRAYEYWTRRLQKAEAMWGGGTAAGRPAKAAAKRGKKSAGRKAKATAKRGKAKAKSKRR